MLLVGRIYGVAALAALAVAAPTRLASRGKSTSSVVCRQGGVQWLTTHSCVDRCAQSVELVRRVLGGLILLEQHQFDW